MSPLQKTRVPTCNTRRPSFPEECQAFCPVVGALETGPGHKNAA
jgi:hypothetical protein